MPIEERFRFYESMDETFESFLEPQAEHHLTKNALKNGAMETEVLVSCFDAMLQDGHMLV